MKFRFPTGAVYVLFLNEDASVNNSVKISQGFGGFSETLSDGDTFGRSVTAVDLNGDQHPELVVGSYKDGTGGGFYSFLYFLNYTDLSNLYSNLNRIW